MTRPGSSAPAPPLGEEQESPTGQPSAPGALRPWRCAPWVAAGMPRPGESRCERAEPRGRLGPAARRALPEPGAVPGAVWKGAGESAGEGEAGAAARRAPDSAGPRPGSPRATRLATRSERGLRTCWKLQFLRGRSGRPGPRLWRASPSRPPHSSAETLPPVGLSASHAGGAGPLYCRPESWRSCRAHSSEASPKGSRAPRETRAS